MGPSISDFYAATFICRILKLKHRSKAFSSINFYVWVSQDAKYFFYEAGFESEYFTQIVINWTWSFEAGFKLSQELKKSYKLDIYD